MNTENSVLIRAKTLTIGVKKMLKDNSILSLRTFTSDDNEFHPHFPIITREWFKTNYENLIKQGLSLILATPIDPEDAELVACAYKRDVSITVDIAYGAGTVRRITHQGKVDKTFSTGLVGGASAGDLRIDKAIRLIRRIPLSEVIFEFSYYRVPVGEQHNQLIFWEVTGASDKGVLTYDNE